MHELYVTYYTRIHVWHAHVWTHSSNLIHTYVCDTHLSFEGRRVPDFTNELPKTLHQLASTLGVIFWQQKKVAASAKYVWERERVHVHNNVPWVSALGVVFWKTRNVAADAECACVQRRTHGMGWLRLVGSLQLLVSFAKEPYKRDDMLQKWPVILRSLLIVANPYVYNVL